MLNPRSKPVNGDLFSNSTWSIQTGHRIVPCDHLKKTTKPSGWTITCDHGSLALGASWYIHIHSWYLMISNDQFTDVWHVLNVLVTSCNILTFYTKWGPWDRSIWIPGICRGCWLIFDHLAMWRRSSHEVVCLFFLMDPQFTMVVSILSHGWLGWFGVPPWQDGNLH